MEHGRIDLLVPHVRAEGAEQRGQRWDPAGVGELCGLHKGGAAAGSGICLIEV